MKSSTILRKAAKNLMKAGYVPSGFGWDSCDDKDRPRYCCGAIGDVLGKMGIYNLTSVAYGRFESLFRENAHAYWFGHFFTKEEQEHRILSMLLCADMCESVGD